MIRNNPIKESDQGSPWNIDGRSILSLYSVGLQPIGPFKNPVKYVAVNLLFTLVGHCSYLTVEANGIPGMYMSSFVRATLICGLITFYAGFRKRINGKKDSTHDINLISLVAHFASVCAVVEGLEMFGIYHWGKLFGSGMNQNYFTQWISLVPKALMLEVIFDFFHYWTHRLCHTNTTLYKLVHKSHHGQVHPGPTSTYQESMADLVLTNMFPSLACYCIFVLSGLTITTWQYHIYLAYKHLTEVYGHSGIDSTSRSFPQNPFAAGYFPDQFLLRTHDHDLHHAKSSCNFSKRFRIWDVVFNTYVQHPDLKP